jgi:hypothetical protein
MGYTLSKRSANNLVGIKPVLIEGIIAALAHPDCPYDFGIPTDGGFRTDEDQIAMYAKGRTTAELEAKGIHGIEGRPDKARVTWTLNSYHKTGNAFDIYAYVGGASWNMKYIEPIARHLQKVFQEQFKVKLDWGQDLWGKDGAHFQITE